MDTLQSRQIATALTAMPAQGASAARIAELTVVAWKEIDTALRPLIGPLGVAALFHRSLHLCSKAHPWLATAHDATAPTINLPSLQALLSERGVEDAAASGSALLQTLQTLLASLVGGALSEQLLRPVWLNLSRGTPAQDTP